MYSLTNEKYDPIYANVLMNGVPVTMDVDTGASATFISKATYLHLKEESMTEDIERSELRLKTYTGEHIQVLGKVKVHVCYNNCNPNLGVHVVEGQAPT